MKKKLTLYALLLLLSVNIVAQDIKITKFQRNHTSLIARMHPKFDNAGDACAVFRCYIREDDFIIEPNLGIVDSLKKDGEIQLWVPKGTKRITIRHKGTKPLVGYTIPITVENKTDYDVDIELENITRKYYVYAGVGFNAASIMGPSMSFGVLLNHHNLELGAIYGINRSSTIYFNDNIPYDFQAMRIYFKYGYEIRAPKFVSLIPQVGGTYNIFNAKNRDIRTVESSYYRDTYSASVFAGIELLCHLGKSIKLYFTPEYDFGVYRSRKCTGFEKDLKNMRSWTEGVNLNAGLLVYF